MLPLPGEGRIELGSRALPVLRHQRAHGLAQSALQGHEHRFLAARPAEPGEGPVQLADPPLVGGERGVHEQQIAVRRQVLQAGAGFHGPVDDLPGPVPAPAQHALHGQQPVDGLEHCQRAEFVGRRAGGLQLGRLPGAHERVGAEPHQRLGPGHREPVLLRDLQHPPQAGVGLVEAALPGQEGEELPCLAGHHGPAALLGGERGTPGGTFRLLQSLATVPAHRGMPLAPSPIVGAFPFHLSGTWPTGSGGTASRCSAPAVPLRQQRQMALDHHERRLLLRPRLGPEQGAGRPDPAARLLLLLRHGRDPGDLGVRLGPFLRRTRPDGHRRQIVEQRGRLVDPPGLGLGDRQLYGDLVPLPVGREAPGPLQEHGGRARRAGVQHLPPDLGELPGRSHLVTRRKAQRGHQLTLFP